MCEFSYCMKFRGTCVDNLLLRMVSPPLGYVPFSAPVQLSFTHILLCFFLAASSQTPPSVPKTFSASCVPHSARTPQSWRDIGRCPTTESMSQRSWSFACWIWPAMDANAGALSWW